MILLELLKCIVNDYTTHFAYKLLDGDQVFVYDSGQKSIMSYEQYISEIV